MRIYVLRFFILSISFALMLTAPMAHATVATAATGVSGSAWSYSKASVLDYLISWKSQIKDDYTLSERERDLRLDLIGRLIFQVDRKYTESDLRQFLIETTWDMALTDEMAQNKVWGGESEFLKNLSVSFNEILEPSENILGFLRSYVEFVTLKTPHSMEEFALSRSYTNGQETETAESLSLEDAGTIAADEVIHFTVIEPTSSGSEIPESHTEKAPDQIQIPSHPQKEAEHPIL